MRIEIYPLDKVVIDGVPIYLGMERAAVEAAIGKGQLAGHRYYYYNSDMAIDYKDEKVEFIEFLGGMDGSLHPRIYGVSAFDTPAEELIGILQQKNDGEIDDSEQGYSFAFLNISVGVYREMRKANHWATIGVGVAGYYQH